MGISGNSGGVSSGPPSGTSILNALSSSGSALPSVSPPSNPVTGALWYSSSLAKLRAAPGPSSRYPLGLKHDTQEPTCWVDNGLFNLLYTANGVWYTSMPATKDPTQNFSCFGSISGNTLTVSSMNWGVLQVGQSLFDQNMTGQVVPNSTTITGQLTGTIGGIGTYSLSTTVSIVVQSQRLTGCWWAQAISVIGNTGQGGYSGSALHGSMYREGSILYYTFPDNSGNVRIATANAATPSIWTVQSQVLLAAFGFGIGCPKLAKQGSTYYLFVECGISNTFPGEGTVTAYEICLASSSGGTPVSAFALTNQPLKSLMAGPNASSGGPRTLVFEAANNQWVMYFHVSTWGSMFLPSDCYRAVTSDISTDSWVFTDNNGAFMRRSHLYEFDQIADCSVFTTPSGTTYMVYTGADNRIQGNEAGYGFNLMISPLIPTWQQYDGESWKQAGAGYDDSPRVTRPDEEWTIQNNPWQAPTGAATTGIWTTKTVSGAPGGVARYNSTNTLNDSIAFDFTAQPGDYTLTLTYQTSAAGGINTVSLNGTAQGSVQLGTIDTYSASTVDGVVKTIPFTIYGTETVRWRLKFTAATKNGSSTGYTLADYGFTIQNAFLPANPTYNLSIIGQSALGGGLTFTRTGNAWADTFNPGSGTAATDVVFSANTPRITAYDRSTNLGLGLYIEDGSTNLFLNSTAPVTQTITVSNATTYTISFDGAGSITYSGAASGILSGTGANTLTQGTISTASTSLVCTVSGSITDVQVEQRPQASSRIVTAGTTVTRNVEKASTTSISWFNPAVGTILCEYIYNVNSNGVGGLFSFDDGTGNNRIDFRGQSGQCFITSGGVNQYNQGAGGTLAIGSVQRMVLGYSQSLAYLGRCTAGQATQFATSGAVGTLPVGITTFNLGALAGGTSAFNGLIRKFEYLPYLLTPAQAAKFVSQG